MLECANWCLHHRQTAAMRRGGACRRLMPMAPRDKATNFCLPSEKRATARIDTFTGRWMNNERFGNCVTGFAQPRNEVVYSRRPAHFCESVLSLFATTLIHANSYEGEISWQIVKNWLILRRSLKNMVEFFTLHQYISIQRLLIPPQSADSTAVFFLHKQKMRDLFYIKELSLKIVSFKI